MLKKPLLAISIAYKPLACSLLISNYFINLSSLCYRGIVFAVSLIGFGFASSHVFHKFVSSNQKLSTRETANIKNARFLGQI